MPLTLHHLIGYNSAPTCQRHRQGSLHKTSRIIYSHQWCINNNNSNSKFLVRGKCPLQLIHRCARTKQVTLDTNQATPNICELVWSKSPIQGKTNRILVSFMGSNRRIRANILGSGSKS